MKKLLTLLLTLAVLILPLAAGAETVQTTAFMISDPVVTVSGTPLYDLTGLGFQLFGDADDSGIAAILKVLANGNAAGDAVMTVDGEKVAFYVSGMQNSYGVTLEYIMQYIESELGVSFSDMGEWAGMLEGWDLGDKLTEAITAYVNENAQVSGPVDMEITLPSGTVTASVMTATIDGNGLLAVIAEVLDGDAIASAALPYLSEYGIYSDSYAEMLDLGEIQMTVTANSAYGENYQYIDCVCSMAGEGGGADMTLDFVTEYTDEGEDCIISCMITPTEEEFAGQYVGGTATVRQDDELSKLSGNFGYDVGESEKYNLEFGGEFNAADSTFDLWANDQGAGLFNGVASFDGSALDVSVTIEGWVYQGHAEMTETGFAASLEAPGMGDKVSFAVDGANYTVELTVVEANETVFALNGALDPQTGIITATVDAGEQGNFALTATPAAVEGYDMCYQVVISIVDEYSDVQLAFNAGVATVTYDTEEVAANFANTVLLTEDDTEAMNAFEADLTNAFSGILVKLMEIPGVAAIVNAMNGQNAQ